LYPLAKLKDRNTHNLLDKNLITSHNMGARSLYLSLVRLHVVVTEMKLDFKTYDFEVA
jgi:hypothetical protein